MRFRDKPILFGVCLPLLCLPLMTSCTQVAAKTTTSADIVPVRAVRVVLQDVPLEISAVGNAEATESVDVKSRIPGQLAGVAFQDGQNVTKGQTLFVIDRSTLERQAAEQRANVARDIAIEEQARAIVARDAASQKQTESEAEIARKLGELGVVSQQHVDQLATASATTRASLHSNQAAVNAAVGATRADQARLAQTQLQLGFTRVVAPISGRAGAVMVKAGNMVRDNDTTLVTILQLAPIQVTFGIPEQSLAEVQRLNAAGSLTVEASTGEGTPLDGRLAFIDNTVNATTGTIRLKATFPNTGAALWPGEFVHVRLRLRTEKDRMLLPQSAIQEGLEGKYVWLAKAGVATIAPVTVLRSYQPQSGPEQAVIGAGVHPGDLVVSEGQLRLTSGARLAFLDTPAALAAPASAPKP